MGNINNNQIYDIWKNSKYEKIRRNLIHNRRDNNLLCKKCDIDGRLEGNEFVNEWSKYYS